MKKKDGIELIFIVVLLLLVILVFRNFLNQGEITNFEECIAAGNPVMESYPRQCRDPMTDRTFVEVIDDWWRMDGILLMQHETEGYFGCFGCRDISSAGPPVCIDPVFGMSQVNETEERYCGEDFEVVEVGE